MKGSKLLGQIADQALKDEDVQEKIPIEESLGANDGADAMEKTDDLVMY